MFRSFLLKQKFSENTFSKQNIHKPNFQSSTHAKLNAFKMPSIQSMIKPQFNNAIKVPVIPKAIKQSNFANSTKVNWLDLKQMAMNTNHVSKPNFNQKAPTFLLTKNFSTVNKTGDNNKFAMVQLKNHAEVPEVVLKTTMINLEAILEVNPPAFYQLVLSCRDPKHKMRVEAKRELEKLALTNSGVIHDYVRDIVLSSVEGYDLFEMTINDPRASSMSRFSPSTNGC